MSWQAEINGNSLPWLLEPEAPGVRYLALRELLDLPPDDPELVAAQVEAHQAGPIAAILDEMEPEGHWAKPGPGYLPKYRSTVWSVITLAQLGASITLDERIAQRLRLPAGYSFNFDRPVHIQRRTFRDRRLPAGQSVQCTG